MRWGGSANLVTDGFLCVPWCVFEDMHFIISLYISVQRVPLSNRDSGEHIVGKGLPEAHCPGEFRTWWGAEVSCRKTMDRMGMPVG